MESLTGSYHLQAEILKRTEAVEVACVSFHAEDALRAAEHVQADVIFINCDAVNNSVELARRLSTLAPDSKLVLATSDDGMFGGENLTDVYAIVKLPLQGSSSDLTVKAILSAGQHPALVPPSGVGLASEPFVVCVQSGKGGVGKSMIAANLAALFARAGNQVCLLDLDLQFGNSSTIATPSAAGTGTILDLVDGETVDPERLRQVLVPVFSNEPDNSGRLDVIHAPQRLEMTELVHPEHLIAILDALRQAFGVIVIDTSTYLEDRALTATDAADAIVLVTSPTITSLENTRHFAEFMSATPGFDVDRLKLVLNQTTPSMYTTLRETEHSVGLPIVAALPYAPRVVEPSIALGRPFVIAQPGALISERLTGLAATLIPIHAEPGERVVATNPWRFFGSRHKSAAAGDPAPEDALSDGHGPAQKGRR